MEDALPLVRRAPRGRGRGAHAARRRLARARSPSRSTGRPRSRRWASCAAGTSSPRRAARSSASTTRCSTSAAIDEAGLADRGRRRAARRARAQPHRPHGRHRRDDPGRAGRGDPRRPAPAPLVVAGGPGTGKTAVALHRAAYLLYTLRRRLGAQGVLLVGPSPVFLRYIEHVLPSLGEQDVQLSTIAGLRPSLRAAAPSPTRPSRAEGRRAAWRSVIERAVADRERPLARRLHRCSSTACSCACAARETVRARRRRARAGAARTTSSARTSRSASSTCSSRATRSAAIRVVPRGASDDAPDADNVTSLFDRDATLDASVAGALGARRGAARRLGAGAARPACAAGPR